MECGRLESSTFLPPFPPRSLSLPGNTLHRSAVRRTARIGARRSGLAACSAPCPVVAGHAGRRCCVRINAPDTTVNGRPSLCLPSAPLAAPPSAVTAREAMVRSAGMLPENGRDLFPIPPPALVLQPDARLAVLRDLLRASTACEFGCLTSLLRHCGVQNSPVTVFGSRQLVFLAGERASSLYKSAVILTQHPTIFQCCDCALPSINTLFRTGDLIGLRGR